MRIKISDISQGRLSEEQSEALEKYFQGGGTWQQLLHLSPMQLEGVYKKGYDFYIQKEYDQAIATFSSLIQLNPFIDKHWLAMGATLHAQEKYEDALAAYELAMSLNDNPIHALFYSAQAAWALQERSKCRDFLEQLLQKEALSKEDQELVRKAKMIQGLL